MESSVIEHLEMDEDGSLAFCEGDGALHSAFEDDFEVFKLEPQGLETQARNMMTNRDIRDVPVTTE
jgi:hypothetical protein